MMSKKRAVVRRVPGGKKGKIGTQDDLLESAVNLIAEGCKMLGWDIAMANNDLVEGMVIGQEKYLEKVVGLIEADDAARKDVN